MSNIDYEDDDLSKYEIDDLDIEEDEVPKKDVKVKRSPKGKGGAPKGAKPSPKGASPKGKITKKKNEKDKNVVYAVAVAGGLMLAVSGYLIFNSISSKKAAAEQAELLAQQQEIIEQQQQYNNSSEVSAGIPSLYGNGSSTNNSPLTNSNEILKDLNGNTIDPNYQVVANNTVTDFINFKKYRATTGNGLEFYWLEARYKGGDYKVQVPYSIYSKLDSEGITVVDAEVLTLDNGSEIVTYMSVRKDAKDLLDKNR